MSGYEVTAMAARSGVAGFDADDFRKVLQLVGLLAVLGLVPNKIAKIASGIGIALTIADLLSDL